MFSGLSLALKKRQLAVRLTVIRYTPLVEVNQANISLYDIEAVLHQGNLHFRAAKKITTTLIRGPCALFDINPVKPSV